MIPDNERGRGSTTWRPVRAIIAPGAAGTRQRPRSGHRWWGCYPWPRKEKISLRVVYRGGAECWYLIEGRGRHGVFPGVAAIHDVMNEIYQAD